MHKIVIALLVFGLVCTSSAVAQGPYYASSEHKISDEGVEFVANFEGLKTTLYNDDAGHCTIGYGHLVHRSKCNGDSSEVEFRLGITKERALELFRNDLATAERAVNTHVTVPLNQAQFDALVSFTYNLGVGTFEKSDLLKELNAGHYYSVPQELDRYVYGGGIRLSGLVRRRHDEGILFQFGKYTSNEVADGRTTILLTLISPGTSSEPGENINTLSPTFRWQCPPTQSPPPHLADYCALYISKCPYGRDNIVFNSEEHYGPIYGDSFTLPPGYLQEGIKYRWNMRAHSGSGWSEFSDKLHFQVQGTRVSTTGGGEGQPDPSGRCLATALMSEASIGTYEERVAVAWTIFNRIDSPKFPNTICYVVYQTGQYATNQEPTQEMLDLSASLITNPGVDLTRGATHFFSPISMPKEGESTAGWNVGGGLHEVTGIDRRVYFPDWTKNMECVKDIPGVRPAFFMFYRVPDVATRPASIQSPIPIAPGTSSEPGQYIDTLSPTFRWQGLPSGLAYGYALYISAYPYGADNIVFNSETDYDHFLYGLSYSDYSSDLCDFTLPSGYLQEGISYRWNMKAYRCKGGWGPISDRLYFNTREGGDGWPDRRPPARDSECSLWITDEHSSTQRYFSLDVPLSTNVPVMAQACDNGQLIWWEKYPDGNTYSYDMGTVSNGKVYPLSFTADTPGQHIIWFSINGKTSNSITFDVSSQVGPYDPYHEPYGPYDPYQGPYGPYDPYQGPYGPYDPYQGPYGP